MGICWYLLKSSVKSMQNYFDPAQVGSGYANGDPMAATFDECEPELLE